MDGIPNAQFIEEAREVEQPVLYLWCPQSLAGWHMDQQPRVVIRAQGQSRMVMDRARVCAANTGFRGALGGCSLLLD